MDENDNRREEMRACINRLLLFAENQNVLDKEMLKRLRYGDYNQFKSAIYELSIAEFLNNIGRINWHPKGRGLHIGEFDLAINNHATIFIEVKAIFESKDAERQDRNWETIRAITHSVSSPFVISVEFIELPNDINANHFRAWFVNQLKELTGKLKTPRKDRELVFIDNKVKIKVTFTRLWKEDNATLCSLDLGVHCDGTHERIIDTISRALKQVPNTQPTMVIIAPSIPFGIDETQVLTAMFSSPKITFPIYTNVVPENVKNVEENPSIHYDLEGIVQPRLRTRLSAVGIWHQEWTEQPGGSLHIYHNPLTAKAIDPHLLKVAGVYQLIPQNKGTMEWIPEKPKKN